MATVLAIFFRDALLSRLQHLYGDSYDGLIEVSILQHWYGVAVHRAPWAVTGYFHPHPATLGYNDTYLVPGVAFVLARLAGADPFVATFMSHVAMKAIGFLGMYVVLRRGVRVRTPLAIGGAALFALANVSALHLYHAQLLSVGLLPWLSFLALRAVEAIRESRSRALLGYGGGFAMLYGVTALNSFYPLWFFSLFLLIFMPVALIAAGRQERRAFLLAAARQWQSLAIIATAAAIALLPLSALYGPKIRSGIGHAWQDGPHLYLPDLTTLFNVGPGNLVWGPVLGIGSTMVLPRGEAQFGFPLGFLSISIVALLWAWRNRAGSGVVLPIGLTIVAMLLLAFRWPGDHSAWWFVYSYVPGATAIRVVTRMLMFALAGLVPLVIVFIERTVPRGAPAAVILAALLVEQVQLEAPMSLSRHEQLRMLAAVGPPPRDCASFFVISARPAGYPLLQEAKATDIAWGGAGSTADAAKYRHNVDAMLLSTIYNRPTINGYSSFNPGDWDFADSLAPDYLLRVRHYVDKHGLRHVCGLDARGNRPWFRL